MTDLDLQLIKERLAAATQGPWNSCPDDGCQCPVVLSKHHPVAEITKGEWGDEQPALRFADNDLGQANTRVEAYTEMFVYGTVPDAEAMANRAFIRESWADIKALIEEVERLRSLK